MSPQPAHDQSPGWRAYLIYAGLVGLAVAAIVWAAAQTVVHKGEPA